MTQDREIGVTERQAARHAWRMIVQAGRRADQHACASACNQRDAEGDCTLAERYKNEE